MQEGAGTAGRTAVKTPACRVGPGQCLETSMWGGFPVFPKGELRVAPCAPGRRPYAEPLLSFRESDILGSTGQGVSV